MKYIHGGLWTENRAGKFAVINRSMRWIVFAACLPLIAACSANSPASLSTSTSVPQNSSSPVPLITNSPLPVVKAAADKSVYSDSLASDWENWSWDTTVNLSASNPVHTGSHAIAVTFTDAWAGLYLHTGGYLPTSDYTTLTFWVHGGSSGNQAIDVKLADAGGGFSNGIAIHPTKNAWTQVSLALSGFTNPGSTVAGLAWQDTSGGSQPMFYLDDVRLIGSTTPSQPLSLSVDVSANRHSISPYIYGMSWADPALAAELRLPLNRWGGNSVTRYNWQNDTSNHASDWYFENIPNDNNHPENLPNGSSSDVFVEQNLASGTQTLLTVPLIGWTPKSRDKTCGFSVSKYGAQQSTDPWMPDCGNGVLPGGSMVTGNNPADTSTAIGPAFVQSWMNHLAGQFGTAANGGVKFYDLDNEPMLWNSTHRDVHPAATTYAEMRDDTYQYAAAIKASDPAAKTLGPVVWGWSAYFDSAAGEYGHAYNQPFLEWYLDQMKAYETAHGVRILDYLDVHFYPQAGQFSSDAGSASMQALRLRSTRALWDPTYVDESWIDDTVKLIPRLKDLVSQHYPGTLTAITEYNWGALNSLNGALTQAEILGIFGREGLDLAALWDPPSSSDPGAYAFRMYRNYDGHGSGFGETSFQSTSTNSSSLSIFAAQRSMDGALTLMVINKTGGDLSAPVAISHYQPDTSAHVYRYSAANLNAIQSVGILPVSGSGIAAMTFPANSISLIVVDSNMPLNHVFIPLTNR